MLKQCENCCSLIDLASFELHSVHCSRFLFLCNCSQLVRHKEKISHLVKFHSIIECRFCTEKFESWEQDKHICAVKLIECAICELQVLSSDYFGHLEKCEARTTQCLSCFKFFKHFEIENHRAKDCMPKLSELISSDKKKVFAKKNSKKSKNSKKKNLWVSIKLTPCIVKDMIKAEDFDRRMAEDLQEDFINLDIAEEESQDFFTKF